MNSYWNRLILAACLLQLPSNTLTSHINIECAVTGVSLQSFYSSDLNVTHLIRIYSWTFRFINHNLKTSNIMVGLSPKVYTFINLSIKIMNGYFIVAVCIYCIVAQTQNFFIQLEHASPEPIVFHSLPFPAQV